MIKKFFKACKSFNMIGTEVGFDINGFSRVPSCFATLLSLLGLVVINVVGIQFIMRAFSTKSPDINVELKTLSVYPRTDIYKDNFFFAIFPIDTNSSRKPNEAFLTFNANINLRKFVKNDQDLIINVTLDLIELDSLSCSEVAEDPRFEFLTKNKNIGGLLSSAYCFLPKKGEEDKYFLQGEPLADVDSSINIDVLPCSLDNPSDCATEDELKYMDFLVIHPNPDVDYSKTEDFLTWIAFAGSRAKIDINSRQMYMLDVKTMQLFKDSSFIGESTKEADFVKIDSQYVNSVHRKSTQIHCPKSIVKNNDKDNLACEPYFTIRVLASNKKEIITRVYPNIIQALSEVGGFRELVFMACGVVYLLYNCYFDEFRRYLVDNVYGYKHSKKEFKEHIGSIEDNMDIVELIKELNGLKVLNRVIFKDHHIALLPKVLAKLKEEDEQKKKRLKNKKSISTLRCKSLIKSNQTNCLSRNVITLRSTLLFSPLRESKQTYFLYLLSLKLSVSDQAKIRQEPNNSSQRNKMRRRRSRRLRSGMTFIQGTEDPLDKDHLKASLNQLKNRIPSSEFERLLNEAFMKYLDENHEKTKKIDEEFQRMEPMTISEEANEDSKETPAVHPDSSKEGSTVISCIEAPKTVLSAGRKGLFRRRDQGRSTRTIKLFKNKEGGVERKVIDFNQRVDVTPRIEVIEEEIINLE